MNISQCASWVVLLPLRLFFSPKPCSVLPTAPEIFFGREDFIAAALDALQTVKPTRIAILGPGGIGKTATALTILQHEKVADIFQQNRFFVSCNAVTTTSMLVGGISAALGIEVTPRDNVLDVLYKKLSSKDSTLLVLDNFETPWEQLGNQAEVEHVLNTIAGIKTVSLIVTIRGSVYPSAAIRWTASQKLPPLLPLSPEAARSTFLALNQLSLTPQVEMDLATLLKELDHVPLAIKIIAQVGTGQSCRHLSKRWREKRTSLLHTRGPQSDHLTSVDVSIAISLQCLLVMENPEAIQLLSLICNLPDGVLMWEDQLASIAKALKSPDNAVSTLLKVSLAFVDAVGTLRVLSPIRYYVLEKHPADAAHVMGMEAFYTAIISRYGVDEQGSNLKIAREKLWPEQGNIQSILRHGLRDHPSEELAEAAYQMSLLLSRTQPSVALLELILPCLRLWDLTVREAECYFLMGEIFRLQSRFLEAQEMLMKSYEQFTAIGQPKKAAQCLHSLSITLRVQGKFAEAQIWVEQAEQEFMVIGEYLGASWCLQSLGDILRVQGRLSEAQGKMEQAQRQFGEMGESVGMAWSTQSLAEIFKADGRILEARSMLGRAQQQFAELSDALGGAWCLQCLGDILRVEKRFSEAQVMLAEAQKQFAGIGEPVGEARCIQTIGEALRGQGKLPEAQVMLKQAAQQFLDIGQHDAAVQCLTEQEYLSRL